MSLPQLLGSSALVIWSLFVAYLVVVRLKREGIKISAKTDLTETAFSLLVSLVPRERPFLYGSLIVIIPIVALAAILWR